MRRIRSRGPRQRGRLLGRPNLGVPSLSRIIFALSRQNQAGHRLGAGARHRQTFVEQLVPRPRQPRAKHVLGVVRPRPPIGCPRAGVAGLVGARVRQPLDLLLVVQNVLRAPRLGDGHNLVALYGEVEQDLLHGVLVHDEQHALGLGAYSSGSTSRVKEQSCLPKKSALPQHRQHDVVVRGAHHLHGSVSHKHHLVPHVALVEDPVPGQRGGRLQRQHDFLDERRVHVRKHGGLTNHPLVQAHAHLAAQCARELPHGLGHVEPSCDGPVVVHIQLHAVRQIRRHRGEPQHLLHHLELCPIPLAHLVKAR
mmetsp:Transcript_8322/g.15768  ORF Transcript_8322/g.15768 Transcript_8322/m.15768 type:complete len:309 (-) Transcript_8322:137-1063(-)